DPDVFNGVVLIDVKVAAGFELEVEASVMGEEFEHVVEEADARRDIVRAAALDSERSLDLRLFADAVDGAFSHERDAPWRIESSSKTSSRAANRQSVCCSVPRVKR